jgi:hypothetical protein
VGVRRRGGQARAWVLGYSVQAFGVHSLVVGCWHGRVVGRCKACAHGPLACNICSMRFGLSASYVCAAANYHLQLSALRLMASLLVWVW